MTLHAEALSHSRVPLIRLHNRVLPVLFAAGAASVFGCGVVMLAPNRLISGRPIGLFAAAEPRFSTVIVLLGLALLATTFLPPKPALHRLAAALAGLELLVILATAGDAASSLTASATTPLARVSLGAAFWVLVGASGLAVVDALQRVDAGIAEQAAAAAVLLAAVGGMAEAGVFDALSLAREYHTREPVFAAALVRHIVLVAAAIGPAVAVGVPLAVFASRRPASQGPIFGVLNLMQTIPSIALFGLLIAPLSALATEVPILAALGIGGIGPAPAIVALVLYALLPIVRNTVAGIVGVDTAALDAARGMGMTDRHRQRQVEFPLALPLLLAGLRIVTVQSIGLAVVAALIGAGGLGTFVFQGLGQDAADLVLLGALPAILLALAADLLLQTLAVLAARRLGR